MSYALGLRTEEGLVLAADSRTNAGADQVSVFRKLHVFEKPGERFLVLAVIGNLSLAQALISELRAQCGRQARARTGAASLIDAVSMSEAARSVGQAIRALEAQESHALARHGVAFDVTALLGGQIGRDKHRLFQIYPAGNFIEAGDEVPYFQIGERKFGKPVLDLAASSEASLAQAVKLALLSFDATVQNNATVGLPVDLIAMPRDRFSAVLQRRFAADDPYWGQLRRDWQEGTRALLAGLPEIEPLAKGGKLIRLHTN